MDCKQLGPGIPKHIGGWTGRTWRRVPVGIPPIGLLRPEALILLVRECLQTLKELLGQPCPRLWIQLEGFGLDFFGAHAQDSTAGLPATIRRPSPAVTARSATALLRRVMRLAAESAL